MLGDKVRPVVPRDARLFTTYPDVHGNYTQNAVIVALFAIDEHNAGNRQRWCRRIHDQYYGRLGARVTTSDLERITPVLGCELCGL
jgi:hypothetical protein